MMNRLRRSGFVLVMALLLFVVQQQRAGAQGDLSWPRVHFEADGRYLVVEFVDDDLVHFEAGSGNAPAADMAIATTPMVAQTAYAGPTTFNDDGQGVLTTAALRVVVDAQTLCTTVVDLTSDAPLTAVCPSDLEARKKSLTIDPQATQHVYGLGEKFRTPGEPNGDWVGGEREAGVYGNEMEPFADGAVGNAQFPIMYALGEGFDNYALFVDVLYKQEWEFVGESWSMSTLADPLRWYLLAGPDLPDLRADYLELTGRPPVPPKALFGLWVSEYGFDDWDELDDKRQTLDQNQFPQDGFVLDLQWFGGIQIPSQMGSISWDEEHFPDPAAKIEQLRRAEGLELVVIEESYVDQGLSNFGRMASQGYLVKECEGCGPATMRAWWGLGGMVDWTNEAAAAFWHDQNRQPLVEMGVLGHWTDLGEPEMFVPNSWYAGLPELELHDQAANHNLYNLKWAESIYVGYERNGVTQRPAILSRSGTSGIQRYGVAMWSADIGSNFESLATHMNAQMNISLSGIDYFGSDIAGFHRGSISGEPLDELYTVWFANSALLDVPVRPHTENLCNCKETAPNRVGDVASNLANIRLRYALSPYLYSVAHRAYLTGEPVVPPLFFYYQDDLETRALGDHKLLGRELLVRTVTEPEVTATAVYLPAGRWVNYHTGEMVESAGGWLDRVSTMPNGLFQLPLFVRAGAIVPQMFVDEQTMNLLGMRRDGTTRDELIVYIVPDAAPTAFTLYEDDGRSIAYQSGEVRQTEISQQWTGEQITVEIGAAEGTFSGAAAERDNVVKLVVGDGIVSAVRVNDTALTAIESVADWETAVNGWLVNAGELWVKTGATAVTEAKEVMVTLSQPSDAAVVMVEDSAAAPAAAPEAAVTEEVPADNVSRVTTRDLLGIGVIILLLVGWLYLRRQKASN